MKIKIAILVISSWMLLCNTGCMSYAQWQNGRRNRAEQSDYVAAVSMQFTRHVPIGTWYYELRSDSKIGLPTQVWLTLGDDGVFNRLYVNRGNLFFHFCRHSSGEWENLGNMRIALKNLGAAKTNEIVDLKNATNSLAVFDQKVKSGIQPRGGGYGSPAAGSPSPHR